MNRLLMFIFFASLGSMSQAQYQRLVQYNHVVNIEISLLDGQLEVAQAPIPSSSLIKDLSVSLQHGEIVIDYQFEKGEEGQNYIIDLEARLDDQNLKIYREDLIGSLNEELPSSREIDHQIIWTRLFDRYINLDGKLVLNLSVELWGLPNLPYGIVCGTPPTFTMKQKLPYIAGAGVGLAAIGAGYLLKQKSNDTYNDEYLTQNFQEAAEPFYQKANDDHQTSLIMRYAGTAVLVIDLGLYIYRSIRHRKKVNAYNEFCSEQAGVEFEPLVELPSTMLAQGQFGLKMTYKFGR